MKSFILSLAALLLLFSVGGRLDAQWRIPRSVLACGGLTMAGGGYAVSSTIGQTIIGRVSAGPDRARFGFWHTYSSIVVHAGLPAVTPAVFRLGSFPNPFTVKTTIRFTLPVRSHVVLEAFDALGRKCTTIADGHYDAGSHDIVYDAAHTNTRSGLRTQYLVLTTHGAVETLSVTVLGR